MHTVSSQNLREMKDMTNSWLEGQNRKSKGEGQVLGGHTRGGDPQGGFNGPSHRVAHTQFLCQHGFTGDGFSSVYSDETRRNVMFFQKRKLLLQS